jgi:hypothetical protein
VLASELGLPSRFDALATVRLVAQVAITVKGARQFRFLPQLAAAVLAGVGLSVTWRFAGWRVSGGAASAIPGWPVAP